MSYLTIKDYYDFDLHKFNNQLMCKEKYFYSQAMVQIYIDLISMSVLQHNRVINNHMALEFTLCHILLSTLTHWPLCDQCMLFIIEPMSVTQYEQPQSCYVRSPCGVRSIGAYLKVGMLEPAEHINLAAISIIVIDCMGSQ